MTKDTTQTDRTDTRELRRGREIATDGGQDQAKIKHHAERGNMGSLLRTIGADTRMGMVGNFADVGIETPADMVAHFDDQGDFEAVEGIGPTTSERVEQAIPHIR